MNDVDLTIAGRPTSGPSGFRLVLTLAIAGTLSGLAIAGAYQVTRPTIEANKARARCEAVFKVVPGAKSMLKLVLRDGALVAADGGDERAESIFAAYDADDRFLGYAIQGEGPGYQDTIRLIYGFDPARQRVIGMYVLDSKETPGLGDRIFKDDDFVACFDDLAVEPEIALVKEGADAENEVDAITGATISSRAVVRIINDADDRWRPRLPAPGDEPPKPPDTPDTPDTPDAEGG
ncbi:MAG: RnfABCDGE type electron transport complex subunit G [Planctomycetes bacterium]|nr:RnfABCDGE type electron transport complex subunit G [Planctomycetota bacterium]